MLLVLACTILLPMLASAQTEEIVHDITCSPDANHVLPITIVNNYLTEVNVIVNCSNNEFEFNMTSGELAILPAFFYDWVNPEKTYPDSACLLYPMDDNAQGYLIHVKEGDAGILNDFRACYYSVGAVYPEVNHYSECNPNDSGVFYVQLENKAETWLLFAVACTNDWFIFHVPPNASVSLPSMFYEWTNYNKTYPNNTCVFFDGIDGYQGAVVYSVESDWDYSVDVVGCTVSFGEDYPVVNHYADCPANNSDVFDVVLANNGDVWLFVDVWCWNDMFTFFMAPNSKSILPSMYLEYHNADKVYPNDTCVFAIWEPGYQEILVYSEESDHDYSFEFISCNYSEGSEAPELVHSIECEDVATINLENNGTVALRVELWCWNDWYLYYIEPLSTLAISAVYRDWTNPDKVYPNDTCIMLDDSPHSQIVGLYVEEPDMDYLATYITCDRRVGEDRPNVSYTSNCSVDSEGFLSIKLENTGLVWVYAEILCWNDYFRYYLSPGSTGIINALFLDWTNLDFIIPDDICVLESENFQFGLNCRNIYNPSDFHEQQLIIYSEESDWDYSFEYIACDYSVGSDTPDIDYSLDCPENGGDFQIGFENSGDVWLFVEIDCWNGWVEVYIEPHSITRVDAVFFEWTDPNQIFSQDVCVFKAAGHRYQEVTAFTWESDWDYTESLLWCDYSVGSESPQIDHNTDCVTNDQGEFTLNLVNTGDVWLYVELACWNGWFYYYLPPQITTNVPAMFYEWTNENQDHPEETCVFEDWGDYQEIEIYNEEPDFDWSYSFLSCDYSVGEEVPVENHWTDCRVGNPGLFAVVLDNPGAVWLYVYLDCRNDEFHYYLAPNSNLTVPAAIHADQELPPNTCLFYEEGETAYIDSYSEEPDWDYTEKRIMCRRALSTKRRTGLRKAGNLYHPSKKGIKTGK